MPVIPDPDLPERRTLTDADGVPLARFTHVERHGRTVADRFELQVPVQRALPVIAAEPVGEVRFCWADSPVCNLYDDSGLPAGPFREPIR